MFSWAALAVVAFAQETDTRKILVAFGDSISAGYGVSREQSYPAQLQKKIDMAGLKWRVVNMGISGDTTQGGVSRMGSAIKRMPSIVLIELGGNDALRGLPLDMSSQNLQAMISASQQAGAQVLLVGMQVPPNYGPDYARQFSEMFVQLAQKNKVPRVPFLLQGLTDGPDIQRWFQADRIHPNASAQSRMLDNVWLELKKLL